MKEEFSKGRSDFHRCGHRGGRDHGGGRDRGSHVNMALIAKRDNEDILWHLRYGHLHLNGLKLLSRKEMVIELLNIGEPDFCEGDGVSLNCEKEGMMDEVPTDFEAEQPTNSAPSSLANSTLSSPNATTNSSSDSIATHASNSSSESETHPRKFSFV
ncbi:hypothetical protein V6N12_069874 [Hibiscus sabdariffa]|uniref:GAG-pre-integrase domain-containing protein n=1 Tax=Hibiscus sabdariffa TaxID=183260 RepID=A0ABR2FF37_9ROSI